MNCVCIATNIYMTRFQRTSTLILKLVDEYASAASSSADDLGDRVGGYRIMSGTIDDGVYDGNGTEIACQCAPPWPSISKPKSKSHQKTSCADRFGEVVSNLISVPKSTRNR